MARLDFALDQRDMLVATTPSQRSWRALDRFIGPVSRNVQTQHNNEAQAAVDNSQRVYSLLDGNHVHATSGLPAVSAQNASPSYGSNTTSVQSITTTDYAEFILQLLDKNSFLSSIMIVVAYIMIFRAL